MIYGLRSLDIETGALVAAEPYADEAEAVHAFSVAQCHAVEHGGRYQLVRVEDGEVLASCERGKR